MKSIRRFFRFVFIGLALIALGYSAVFGITLLRFSTTNVDGTRYFYHESSEAEISSLHTLAVQNLQNSGFYEGALNVTVVLTQSPFEFRVLSFFRNARAFGNSFTPLSYIVIAPSNISDDTVITASERYNQRILHGVLAHEFVHLLLYSHFGLDTLVQIPVWKVEGYADYIAQEGSYPEAEGMVKICAAESDNSPSFAYFRYRKVVENLLSQGLSFEEIASETLDFDQEQARTKAQICQ